jgi:hypothetical protein
MDAAAGDGGAALLLVGSRRRAFPTGNAGSGPEQALPVERFAASTAPEGIGAVPDGAC